MGKWARKRSKNTLKDESYRTLLKMYEGGKGRNKKEDKNNLVDLSEFIYSSSTFKTYYSEMKKFIKYIGNHHPEVKRLRQLKIYANEYLQSLIDDKKSAYTITTAKSAIAKTLKLDYSHFIETPSRNRSNIKNNRHSKKSEHLSQKNYDFYSKITSGTGLRRRELERITGDAIFYNSNDNSYYLKVTKGTKGGRKRVAKIMGKNKEETKEIVDLFMAAGKMRVVPKISSAFSNHAFRAVYAKRIYNHYARDIKQLDFKDKYIMRKDRAGEVLDRKAMKITSEFLGHSRIDVIAQSYLHH